MNADQPNLANPPLPSKHEQVLTLRVSVKLGPVRYSHLRIERLTGIEAFIAEHGSSIDTAIRAVALSAKVPQDVIERLGPRDFLSACEAMTALHPEIDSHG